MASARSTRLSLRSKVTHRAPNGYTEVTLHMPYLAQDSDHTGWIGVIKCYPPTQSGEGTIKVVSRLAEDSLLWAMWKDAVAKLLKDEGISIYDCEWAYYIGRYGQEWKMAYPGDSAALQQAANDTCPNFNQAR